MKIAPLACLLALIFFQCQPTPKHAVLKKTNNGYTYESVTNDPTNTRIYTLDNGLKVYLSKDQTAPRIHIFTAIKAGGKNDPADNTGLAHYLEHIMFKGNDVFGTKDYESEKVLLDSIERLFNQYGKTNEDLKRKELYRQIDAVSNEAAKFAIPNEYDKMISLIGGKMLNAYTTEDRTVYTVDIPANELERFLQIEGIRFKKIVNRLFHTELEAVYEEKNRSLDNDYWKAFQTMNKHLFPNHPYGKQTVIGTIEHLKNPSITEILKYFDSYYRPNNAAICMSGDLDYDKTIALIEAYFGEWEPNENLPLWTKVDEPPLVTPFETEIYGPQEERVSIGFRFDGNHTEEFKKIVLIDMLLNNSSAGLIDLNLMQQQKVLRAGSYVNGLNDYSIHTLFGTPKSNQSLDEVKNLILNQIDSIKQGAFEPWLLKAVVTDLKKKVMEQEDSNYANYFRANEMVLAFTNNTPWIERVSYFDDLSAITKDELVSFANEHYKENYVVVKKKNGEDPNAKKIEKPIITKVPLNREVKSDFYNKITQLSVEKIQPKFLDFTNDLTHYSIGNLPVIYKRNVNNDLFELSYVYEFANNADPKFGLALTDFLEFVGTDELSPEEIKQEFYKLGSSYSVRNSIENDRLFITLRGLNEHFKTSLKLFESLLNNASGTKESLKSLVDRIKKQREDNLKNKGYILWNGLLPYSNFGKNNPSNLEVSNSKLDKIEVDELVEIIQEITSYPHRISYYGNLTIEDLSASISEYHQVSEMKNLPEISHFEEKNYDNPVIYWSHYDMVQTELILIAKSFPYDHNKEAIIRLFNEYFGGGMNSIVFQEIREAQGLAYSVFSNFRQPNKKEFSNYLTSYIGIQSDKQEEAISSMFDLINKLPESKQAFEIAKMAILNKIESERISKSSVIYAYFRATDKGLNHDIRKDIYEAVKKFSFSDLLEFHKDYIKNIQQNIVLIGNREKIDFENLSKYGKVIELSHEELFAY